MKDARVLASSSVSALFILSLALATACVPKRDLPPAEIQKLASLEEVMHVQATIADPQFDKIGKTTYTDADYAAFADVGPGACPDGCPAG